MEQSKESAKSYIEQCFAEQGDFAILPQSTFDAMLLKVMELDESFMKNTGVEDGAVYDDDAAFDYMQEQMTAQFSKEKMYCMRFVEDYMDYQERYLESIGALEWE